MDMDTDKPMYASSGLGESVSSDAAHWLSVSDLVLFIPVILITLAFIVTLACVWLASRTGSKTK